jgi:short-subunit dehydrogenase
MDVRDSKSVDCVVQEIADEFGTIINVPSTLGKIPASNMTG